MWKKVLSFLGFASAELVNGTANLQMTEDQAKEINSKLDGYEALQGQLAESNQLAATQNEEIKALNAQIVSLGEKITSQEAEIAELRKLPAAQPAKAITSKDAVQEETKKGYFSEEKSFVDNLKTLRDSYGLK